MIKTTEKLRMILKFDTGADGFQKMIYVLAVAAVVVLASGIYFMLVEFKKILPN